MGINLGGFLGPLICGQLRQDMGWHYGFAAAGVGMVLGLIQYKLTEKTLGTAGMEVVPLTDANREHTRRKNIKAILTIIVLALIAFVAVAWMRIIVLNPVVIANTFKYLIAICVTLYFIFVFAFEKLNRDETRKVIAIALIFVFTAIFYAGFEGQGSSLNVFAVKYTYMTIGSFLIPFEWLQSLPSLYIFAFVPLVTMLWLFLSARKQNPTTPVKISLGLLFMGLGYFVMVGASYVVIDGEKPLPTWLALTYMLHTFGEICLYPIGLSGITKLSPKRLVGRMMGVFFMALALGNLMAGIFAGELDEDAVAANPHLLVDLFQGIGIVMIVSALVVLLVSKPLRKLMGDIR
jgi:POT family proton-dependent oligopeptide transporter